MINGNLIAKLYVSNQTEELNTGLCLYSFAIINKVWSTKNESKKEHSPEWVKSYEVIPIKTINEIDIEYIDKYIDVKKCKIIKGKGGLKCYVRKMSGK